MAKYFAIKGKKGDYRFFSKSPEESKKRFLDSKSFGDEWPFWHQEGYRVVQVDLREVAVIE